MVPQNPFMPDDLKRGKHHFLCAISVEKLMEWWPGLPHVAEPDLEKVKAIQRSLDWKRVAQIAAYLLQEEIQNVGEKLEEVFGEIYDPRKNDPGREWPPRIRGSVKFAKSSFPFFSNVLVHVNGATYREDKSTAEGTTAELELDPSNKEFNLTVIDGQHRVNGAYLALTLLRRTKPNEKYDVPAEVFLDLDKPDARPVRQAQIFIDVNYYQKKVDRSLVADLFPLARGKREPTDRKERAQDIGRKLMLEVGPLVGMIQIPGIKYGVKDVVTLATLNSAIEAAIPALVKCDITNLESQSSFLAQVLECWLKASGRSELESTGELGSQNVVYQGRILVSVVDLIPAILLDLKKKGLPFVSSAANKHIQAWLSDVINRAGLLHRGKFVEKDDFKKLGFLGSGGIGRFRDLLWAAAFSKSKLGRQSEDKLSDTAFDARSNVNKELGAYGD